MTNDTNFSYCSLWYKKDSDVVTSIKQAALGFVGIYGIMANLFVIILAVKYTARKNLHHLIIGMAISDTILIFMQPFFYIQRLSGFTLTLYPHGTTGIVVCKITAFLYNVLYSQSLLSLMIIGIKRYRATGITLRRSRPYTMKQRMMTIGCSWFIPMALFGNTLYHATMVEEQPGVYLCKNTLQVPDWFMIIQPVLIILTFIVIFTLSVLTIQRLSQPHAGIRASLNERHRIKRTQRIRATVRMVLSSLLLYTVCWLPYYIYALLLVLDHLLAQYDVLIIDMSICVDFSSFSFLAFYFLPLVNSSFSPCMYLIFLPDFRNGARIFLGRKNASGYNNTMKGSQRPRGTSLFNISSESKISERKERNPNEIKTGYHADTNV